MCCQYIGVFKLVVTYLPNVVAILYFIAFIRSSYSCSLMFWFHDCSDKCKLTDKICRVIMKLASTVILTVQDCIIQFHIPYFLHCKMCLIKKMKLIKSTSHGLGRLVWRSVLREKLGVIKGRLM